MAVEDRWDIRGFSSMSISRRYVGVLIAGFHSLVLLSFYLRNSAAGYISGTDTPLQAHEHHRQLLQSLPSTTYPLEPVGHPAEVPESQRVNDQPFGQR